MPRRENLPEKERFNCLLKRFNNNTASGLLNLPGHAGSTLSTNRNAKTKKVRE